MAQTLDAPAPRLSLPRPAAWLAALALEGVGKISGKPAPLSRSGVAFFSEDRQFSWARAREELGYTPEIDLQTGMRLTVSWYREHGLL